jgi:hypothetical protein
MPVPNTFANATATIPLSQLDANFATTITLGNTAIQLGNTVSTLNNMTLANVTVTSGNVTITNVSVTTANVTTANITNLIVSGTGTFAAGSNTAPSITFSGDTNTGIFSPAADTIAFTEGGTEVARFNSSGRFGIQTTNPLSTLVVSNNANENVEFVSGSAALNGGFLQYINRASASTRPDMNYYLSSGGGSHKFYTNDLLRATLDSAGNLGLGVAPSAWSGFTALQIQNGALFTDSTSFRSIMNGYYNGSNWIYSTTNAATRYEQLSGIHRWFNAPSGTAGNAITFTQAMTLDASGNLGIGTTSFVGSERVNISFNSATSITQAINTKDTNASANGNSHIVLRRSDDTYLGALGRSGTDTAMFVDGNSYLALRTGGTERARITSAGVFLIGKTATGDYTTGVEIQPSGAVLSYRDNGVAAIFGRTNDGEIVRFTKNSAIVGDISVSGTTVSYNAFSGSHWSQLQDGSKPDILRGTVMESINELCEWPNESNERLPKSKISDTAGSKKVYGVFMAWDNDWTTTNDMYVTAVGAFICRISSDVTVQEGDLLESNGDGTARVQADDIIRSSTIGKVTSTVKTHEYDDGSYCVPTVLYCG